jgi:hypothetical protein
MFFFILVSASVSEVEGKYKWNYIFLFTEMKIIIEMVPNCRDVNEFEGGSNLS